MTRPSDSIINFENVTLTVTFDLLLKIFIIGHNFFIQRDRAFIFGSCVPCDKLEYLACVFLVTRPSNSNIHFNM